MSTLSEGRSRPPLLLVKLGGSLITDKSRPENLRPEVLRRLAEELAAAVDARGGGVVLGHGSGSFGHAAARSHGFGEAADRSVRPAALSAVQDAAARLHRRVIAALITAGVSPFSIVPGSAFVANRGRLEPTQGGLVERALDAGCLPVLYGDLVLDRERRGSIVSTETVFLALVRSLLESGERIDHVLWLGETEGVLDASGRLVRRIDPDSAHELVGAVGGAAGIDVTGGMRHRLDAVLTLARWGVRSRIADGRIPGLLKGALVGEETGGTLVVPAAAVD